MAETESTYVERAEGQDNDVEPLPAEPEDQAPEDLDPDSVNDDDLAPEGSA